MANLNVTKEFRKFACDMGYDMHMWFENGAVDDFDVEEVIALVDIPYRFVAHKIGIKVGVYTETASDSFHCVVTYADRIVLESKDFNAEDFTWKPEQFAEWFEETCKSWRERLKLAKLLFD